MTSPIFDAQIKDLSIRTLAYHQRCQDRWSYQPPPPHYGAPFLFAYIWANWTKADRRALVEGARTKVEENMRSMLVAGSAAGEEDTNKMELLLACCVPEIFQDELYEELRPMAQLLSLIWKLPTKADRAAAVRDRPKHISCEMGFIDQLPFVWAQPTVKLIEQTLQLLHYKVFDGSASSQLSPADNEMYQRDLLLSLRAFWMSFFGLQIFMNLCDKFHETELILMGQGVQVPVTDAPPQPITVTSNSSSNSKLKDEEPKENITFVNINSGATYKKPIHTMKIEDVPDEHVHSTNESINSSTTDTVATPSTSSNGASSSLAGVPAHVYCAQCRASPMAALLSVTSSPKQVSILDPASIAANKSARVIELKRCSRCRSVWYCSVDCQKTHFKQHKLVCTSAAASANQPLSPSSTPTV